MEAVGEPTLTLLDFDLRSSYTQVTSYDPSNLDFRIWLGWSRDGKIHFAGQFADDAYYNEYDPTYLPFSFYDSISLMVDGDHSGGEYDSQLITRRWKDHWRRTCKPSGTGLFLAPLVTRWSTCLGLRVKWKKGGW